MDASFFSFILVLMSMGAPIHAPVVLASAPTATFQQVFSGQVAPLTMPFGSLNTRWRRLVMQDAAGFAEVANLVTKKVTQQSADVMNDHTTVYTRGQCVTIEGETYVIAYRLPDPLLTQLAMGGGAATLPAPLAATTPLALVLLRYADCEQLLNVALVNPAKELAAAAKAQRKIFPVKPTPDPVELTSLNQLRQIATAVQMFVQDNKGKYPTFKNSAECGKLLLPYLGKSELLTDPQSNLPYQFNLTISGRKEQEIDTPISTVVVFEPKSAPDGTRGVGFADGHVRRFPETRWERVKIDGKFPVVEDDEANALSDARLRLLSTAVKEYLQDQNRQYPPFRDPETTKAVLTLYLSQPDAFIHPVSREAYLFNAKLSMRAEKSILDRAAMPMIYEPSPAPDGTRGVVFADGHYERMTVAQWDAVKKTAGID